MPRFPLLAMSVLVCAAVSGNARADAIAHATAAYLDAEFQTAERAFEAVLDRRSLTRGAAAQAHRYLATLKAHTDRSTEARFHTRAALALDPAVHPAPGSPSSVDKMFRRFRREQGRVGAKLELEWRDHDGKREVVATTHLIPDGLAHGMRLRCSDGKRHVGAVGFLPEVSVEVPARRANITCTADAVTQGGASLFTTKLSLPDGSRAKRRSR